MNLTHKVSDIRNFINACVKLKKLFYYLLTTYASARPGNNREVYTIGTTFPNRTLTDDSQTIEAAGLVNSVITQRLV